MPFLKYLGIIINNIKLSYTTWVDQFIATILWTFAVLFESALKLHPQSCILKRSSANDFGHGGSTVRRVIRWNCKEVLHTTTPRIRRTRLHMSSNRISMSSQKTKSVQDSARHSSQECIKLTPFQPKSSIGKSLGRPRI